MLGENSLDLFDLFDLFLFDFVSITRNTATWKESTSLIKYLQKCRHWKRVSFYLKKKPTRMDTVKHLMTLLVADILVSEINLQAGVCNK